MLLNADHILLDCSKVDIMRNNMKWLNWGLQDLLDDAMEEPWLLSFDECYKH